MCEEKCLESVNYTGINLLVSLTYLLNKNNFHKEEILLQGLMHWWVKRDRIRRWSGWFSHAAAQWVNSPSCDTCNLRLEVTKEQFFTSSLVTNIASRYCWFAQFTDTPLPWKISINANLKITQKNFLLLVLKRLGISLEKAETKYMLS